MTENVSWLAEGPAAVVYDALIVSEVYVDKVSMNLQLWMTFCLLVGPILLAQNSTDCQILQFQTIKYQIWHLYAYY
jgi:hypothetical protein